MRVRVRVKGEGEGEGERVRVRVRGSWGAAPCWSCLTFVAFSSCDALSPGIPLTSSRN